MIGATSMTDAESVREQLNRTKTDDDGKQQQKTDNNKKRAPGDSKNTTAMADDDGTPTMAVSTRFFATKSSLQKRGTWSDGECDGDGGKPSGEFFG